MQRHVRRRDRLGGSSHLIFGVALRPGILTQRAIDGAVQQK
jgi:hypothetical protein